MSDEHRIRADEDIVPHLRLEKRLLTWRAADKIERLTAERDALRAQVAEKDAALEKMDGDARWTISDVEHDLTDMRLRAEHAEAERDGAKGIMGSVARDIAHLASLFQEDAPSGFDRSIVALKRTAEFLEKYRESPTSAVAALTDQYAKVEAERDALRALLREAREYTGYAAYGDRIEADHAVDLCARIDAALNEGGGDE